MVLVLIDGIIKSHVKKLGSLVFSFYDNSYLCKKSKYHEENHGA